MVLPGRLTVAFLDEDNPLKSFFRMRPILTEDAGHFMPSDTDENFPEEGFIRIVPDKNEIMMFKTRMRQMGRYCALDLRKHLGENDKIRPNKNHIFGGPEHSQFIVYSDVIGRVPPHLIAEVIETDEEPVLEKLMLDQPMPGTIYVLIRRGDVLSGPWSWSMEGEQLHLSHAKNQPFSELEAEPLMTGAIEVDLPGGERATLMHDLSAFGLSELTAQEFEVIVDRGLFGAQGLNMPQPGDPLRADAAPTRTAGDAPWISRSDALRPKPLQRIGDASVRAQSGMNPRRGRSLHEVVDEQWRKSRYDQLGHPVPGQAFGRPISSPIERAVSALCEAWNLKDMRGTLLDEALSIDDLRAALCEKLGIEPEIVDISEHIEELETRRLALEGEVAALKQQSETTRAGLLQEVTAANADRICEQQQQVESLKAELSESQSAAAKARAAAESAKALLGETSAQLEDRLKTMMFIERMGALSGSPKDAPLGHVDTYAPAGNELVSAVRAHLEGSGFALDEVEIAALLTAIITGDALIFSGPAGSGKTGIARAFAGALGLGAESGRFVTVRDALDPAALALIEKSDGLTPVLVLIDDFNTGDSAKHMRDIVALQEKAATANVPLGIMLTAQDAPEGKPLSARLMGRSFLIRMEVASAISEWQPPRPELQPASPAVSLSALRGLFRCEGELPGDITLRMGKLRSALDAWGFAPGRRTLDSLYVYCAAASSLTGASPQEAFDAAVAYRAMPQIISSMEIGALRELPALIADMPLSLSLTEQPLPLPPL